MTHESQRTNAAVTVPEVTSATHLSALEEEGRLIIVPNVARGL